MKNILVSGLVNVETTIKVRGFPINYYPIDYPFFGVQSRVSGVCLNLAAAAHVLGDAVRLQSMTGTDFESEYICQTLKERGIPTDGLIPSLKATPTSAVRY